ncbi:DUF4126 domain-containing protein [Moraxella cuniculi]|uniref:DUF4126 domain-containing protein n=1 Tax=Moraxella cuniculi TaxID=34061 RepID=A0A3S4SDL7_9GAMM|nr:DUF4126 domain-containing protein [Moraxella cuniculi]VEG13836.1 Uncharacterised protein [Moraxella cuniculi]
MNIEMILSVCLGVGLAASAGFRLFVPLFALSLAAYFGLIPLNDTWLWLGSLSAVVILGVASVVESVSYLVPVVDNLLDTIAVPLAGVAGTLVMASTLADFSPATTWALAIVAGGGAATAIKTTSAATRAVSTVGTAGTINPAIGMVETGAAIGLSAVSIVFPIIGMVIAVLGIVLLIWLFVRLKRQFAK